MEGKIKHTIHESEVPAKKLPGRDHKMIISPTSLGSKRMCFGIAIFPPESHAPSHIHPGEEEIIYILSGYGQIFFDGEPEDVRQGTCVYIPEKTEHSIKNDSKEPMKLAYVFSPPVVQGSYDRNPNTQ